MAEPLANLSFLVIDDHPFVRDGVASNLRQLAPQVDVQEAGDGAAALAWLAERPAPDLVLLDLQMGGLPGIPTLEQIQARHPAQKVLVLSSSEEPADVRRALAAGARGYCPKSAGRGTLLAAVRLVLDGEIYLPPLMLRSEAADAPAARGTDLTPRQREVLQLLCGGHANREIGVQLGMHEKTVKAHVTAIFRSLGVVSRPQAVAAARAAGLTHTQA